MDQLRAIATPILNKYVHSNPSGGGSYVAHPVIVQKILMDLGPYDWELVTVIRGDVQGRAPDPTASSNRARAGTPDLHDAIVGAVCRLTVTIDGRPTRIEEVGDCESPHNWPHDGARLKDAMSDALKRAAMRCGVGLSIWAKNGDEYFLDAVLNRRADDKTA